MTITINGSTGITFPAGGSGNTAGTVVGTSDSQTMTNKTLTSPTITGAVMSSMGSSVITAGTVNAGAANPLSGGTAVDFTSIPSWVKRITVIFQGVSTSSTSNQLVQLGTGAGPTFTTSGYVGTGGNMQNSGTTSVVSFTTGFGINTGVAAYTINGSLVIKNITGNTWVADGVMGSTTGGGGGATATMLPSSGYVALGAVLTAVRITTVNGTDTFDAGAINILYE